MIKALRTVGRYFMLMGRTFSRPERMRMFFRQYLNELEQLGVNSIGIVLLISFFIGAVITIQIKLNIESPWMPRWTVGYVTREIMLLEFSSSIMCLILAGKVGSNIASELGTMRVTQQIDALEIMGINSANYLILPKITAMVTVIPILVTFSIYVCGVVYLGRYHQIPLFCVYYCKCVCFLRIYGRWWIDCCGKGFYGCRSIQQCIDSVCGLDIN